MFHSVSAKDFGGTTVSQMQTRAKVVTGVYDVANVALSATQGSIFGAVKGIAKNGLIGSVKSIGSVYKQAGSKIWGDLGGFKGKLGGGFDTKFVQDAQ